MLISKNENSKRIEILISGRVQGVMFRQSAKNVADDLNLTGKAENLNDGNVCIIAEGVEENLKKFLDFVSNGTPLSKVENVSFRYEVAKNEFTDFQIVRDKGNIFSDQLQAFSNLAKKVFKKNDEEKLINQEILVWPKHVTIVPDGNRRWAKLRGLPTFDGHKIGIVDRFKEITEFFYESPIEVLTLWCFSTENWNREESEVSYLMKLFIETVANFENKFMEKKVRFIHIGRKDRLSREIIEKINKFENMTKDFTGKTIVLALDYGGRDEILRAVKKMSQENIEINEENLSKNLDTRKIPDPDLIIRTSGEKRLSGIYAWQGTYAELYFTEKFFPDFGKEEFKKALVDYSSRKRRFGK